MSDKALMTMNDMERLATSMVKSKLFGIQSVDQALALMATAVAEGRHPASVSQDYSIIQGRPSKRSEAMLRDFLAGGGRVEWHELTDENAEATFSHPAGGRVRITWDMARAEKAGLTGRGGMYQKYPRAMLRARCVSEGVRTVFPAATGGLYTPEESHDIAAEAQVVEVTPRDETPGEISVAQHDELCLSLEKAADLEELKRAFLTATSHAKAAKDAVKMMMYQSIKDERKQQLLLESMPAPEPESDSGRAVE